VKKSMLLGTVLCLILSGCSMVHSPPEEEYGSLTLTLSSSGMGRKDIVPPLDMEIAYYGVFGDGPGAATVSRFGVTGTTIVEVSLVTGEWTIRADAFNADGYLIGTGSVVVGIAAGQSTQAQIRVTPLEGNGELSITVAWPAGTVANPALTGTLEPLGGSPQVIPFMPGTNSASYSYPSLDAGYYLLTLQLSDGPVQKWGAAEAIRILKDQTTEASFTLTAEDVNSGEVDLTIVPDMGDPIAIYFEGHTQQLPAGLDMTVTATTSNDPMDDYRWYLNGVKLVGATGSSITIGNGLPERNHRLDLTVTKGNVLSSGHITFSVIAPPAETVYTNLSEGGAQLDVYLYKGPQFDVYPSPIYTIWVEDSDGTYMHSLFVSNGIGTNQYPMSGNWAARPMCAPYWAHKSCIEDPYAGDPAHDTTGMYLALPSGAGGPPPYPEGPIPSDLDAVTQATRLVDFHLRTNRKDDGMSQFRVLLEIGKAWDYNSYYTKADYNLPGQPTLIYGVDVDTQSTQKLYTMSLLGAGHVFGSDGAMHSTENITTALDILGTALVHVRE